jgi:UTP--glucose-1-phosphate uridylyltransferase
MTKNKRIDIAVIPMAGEGQRMREITGGTDKELLPLGGATVIEKVVAELKEAGIRKFVFVISAHKTPVGHLFCDLPHVEFVYQQEPRGLGDAVYSARNAVGNNPFLLALPDDVFGAPPGVNNSARIIDLHHKHGGRCFIALDKVRKTDVSKYGIIRGYQGDHDVVCVHGIVEKPDMESAPSKTAVVGRYALPAEAFEYLEPYVTARGTMDCADVGITAALNCMALDYLKAGKKSRGVFGAMICGTRYDCGDPEGYQAAEKVFGGRNIAHFPVNKKRTSAL